MTQPNLNLLSMTCHGYMDAAFKLLGKGRFQARALYREWYKEANLEGKDPCFANARDLHKQLLDITAIPSIQPRQIKREADTIKFTMLLEDGYETESVIIPMQAGVTLCLSSQVGCRMGCRFCETGRLGLIRHLAVHEITAQLACARHYFGAKVRNLVFMGMGEPMDNLDAVIPAIEIFSDPQGFNIGRRHITVSTSGHLEGLEKFQNLVHPPVNLAVSVIAADDVTRTKLMPVNRRWNMAQLYEAMRRYCEKFSRQILVEYVLIHETNDSLEDAQKLANYVQGLDVKINLIPYNAQSRRDLPLDLSLQPSSPERCDAFAAQLRRNGLRTLLRKRKGHDIMAACGQLGNIEWRALKQQGNSSKLYIVPSES